MIILIMSLFCENFIKFRAKLFKCKIWLFEHKSQVNYETWGSVEPRNDAFYNLVEYVYKRNKNESSCGVYKQSPWLNAYCYSNRHSDMEIVYRHSATPVSTDRPMIQTDVQSKNVPYFYAFLYAYSYVTFNFQSERNVTAHHCCILIFTFIL